jgi:hypothetical protein
MDPNISTAPIFPGDINAYINLLTRDGNITLVGAPEKP